jgi:hypothetical protein
MSDFDFDDDDFGDVQGDSGALRDLRKAYKTLQKQLKDAVSENESLKSSVRERSVKDVLASKGLPEKIAKFIPSDATSAEEVEAWLSENGDVFGAVAAETQGQPQQDAPVDPNLAAWQRISQTQSSGQPFTNDPDQLSSLINSAANPEELNKILFGTTAGPQAV